MGFQVLALDEGPFTTYYGLHDGALAERGVMPFTADSQPGFPCRVSMRDARPGERVLLLNFEHLPVENPYRSSHAIFVIDGAQQARLAPNEVPPMLEARELAVRAFDKDDMMTDACVVPGSEAGQAFSQLLSDPRNHYLQVHNVSRGCYLARVERRSD